MSCPDVTVKSVNWFSAVVIAAMTFTLCQGCGGSENSTGSATPTPARKAYHFEKNAAGDVIGVSFSGKQASDSDLSILTDHKDIQSVMFMECPAVTDAAIESLNALPQLSKLTISNAKISDNGLAKLSKEKLPNLVSIALTNLPVTDTGMSSLTSVPKCENMELFGLGITDEGLKPLAEFDSLKSLAICNCTRVNGTGLVHLQNIGGLKNLDLRGTVLTSEGLQQLGKVTQLETLLLDTQNVNDEAIAQIGMITSLLSFECIGSPVTDSGLSALTGLPNIQTLTIHGAVNVTADGLKHVGQLKSLKKLYLTHCPKLSDAGMTNLENLTGLELISVMDSGISEDAARKFKKTHPDCDVYYGVSPGGKKL